MVFVRPTFSPGPWRARHAGRALFSVLLILVLFNFGCGGGGGGVQQPVVQSNPTGGGSSTATVGAEVHVRLLLNPTSLDFGEVPLGVSITQVVTLVNSGNANVSASAISVTGAGFTADLVTPLTLAPGQVGTFNLRFAPTAAGVVTGSVTITSNAENSPATLSLAGKGVAPAAGSLSASPSSITFGDTVVGSATAQNITLINGGGSVVTVTTAPTVSGAAFSITGLALPLALGPGQSVTFSARFSPAAAGNATGSISIASDAPISPTVVSLSGNGIAPILTVTATPSSINFGDVSVGATDTRNVTVTNTGNASVTISALTPTGAAFSVTGATLPATLAPGQSTSFGARFAPTATGSAAGSISIVSTASNSPTTVGLTGNGIAAPAGVLTPSPSSVSFGDAVVGSTSSASVTLTNTGNANLTITSASVNGTGFSTTGLTLPLTLTPGQSTTFTARFAPAAAGAANGSLSLVSNGSNSPTTLTLTGNGVAQVLTLSVNPTTINFGDVTVGSTTSQSVTVMNTGNASVTITSAPVAGAGFSVTGLTLPLTLTAGQSSSFSARFAPAATGAVSGNLQLVSNATTSPNTITLNGNGTPAPAGVLTPSPSTLDFGDVIVGNTASQTVQLTNSGNANLTITSAPVTGAGFSTTGLTLPLTLTPGQSSTFTARFAPGAAGAASGNISLASNASNSPTAVTLNGNGVAQVLTLSVNPTNINFGDVTVGSTTSQSVTVMNTGNTNVTITSAPVVGAGFSVTGLTLPLTLTVGQSSSFTARFAPGSAGAVSGSVSLASNATTSPNVVTLNGNGVTVPVGTLVPSPSTVNFGGVIVGNTSSQTVTLTNTGNADLTITSAPVAGAGFSVTGLTLPLTLTPSQTSSFTMQFAPAAAGAVGGSVSLVSNASNTPTTVTLAGTGIAQVLQLTLNPSNINFGDVVTATTVSRAVTVTNTGNSNVTITSASVVGAGFSVTGLALPQTLTPNQSISFNAQFAPGATGAVAGSISLVSNAPTATLTLSGNGVTPGQLNVNPLSLDFGNIVVGNSDTRLITLTNTGGTNVNVASAPVTGTGFSTSGFAAQTLTPGGSMTFNALFTPGAAGAASGSITVNSDAVNPTVVVSLAGTGVAQVLTVSLNPSTINFGDVTVGSTANQTVTMTNTGNFNVNVTAANVTGTGFSAVGFVAQTLVPGQSATFTARFAPSATGAVAGNITLTSTATNNPSVSLSANGIPTPVGTLTLSPTSINFGSVIVGNTVSQTVTLTNTGAASLTITSAPVAGAGFSVTGLTLPLTLTVGQSSTFTARFAPGSAGAVSGSVSLTSNASNTPTSVALSGTGVAQILTLSMSPSTINFGNVTVGNTANQTVTLTNTGNSNVNVTAATATGAGFSVVGFVAGTLTPGQSTTFTARFAPGVAGAVSGTLSLTSNATNNPTVSLSGTGTPPPIGTLTLNPTSINFGSVIVGNTVSQSVTMTNTGTASLTISSSSVTGAGFSVTGLTLPLTLTVGQSSTFTARFAPGSAGAVSGSVSLTSDASNSPASVALSGTGVAQVLTLSASPTSLNFGSVSVGSSSTQSVTVTNSGNSNVTISSSSVTGAGFTISGLTLPLTLTPSQSTSFSVQFAPAASGAVSGSVSLTSNASNSPTTVSLSGTGATPTLTLTVSPTSINFGDVVVGSTASQTVTLLNTGSGDVTVTAINVTGTGYSFTGVTPPLTLTPGQSATVTLQFAPAAAGTTTGTASVVSNATNSPSNISLSGNGTSGIPLSWDASISSGVVGYNLYRATTTGGPYVRLNASVIPGTSFTDRTAQAAHTYFYVATAVDADGIESIFSNELKVILP